MTEQNNYPAQADNQGALYAALAAAQGAFLPIEKNRSVLISMKSGGSYQFKYADLEQILAKTRPALAANGLAIFQLMDSAANNARLRCELVHKDGGRVSSEVAMPSPHTLQDPKQFGATVSYFRRYMVTAMLGVAADDDLDEDGNDTLPPAQRTAGKPAVTQPQRQSPEATPNAKQPQQKAAAATGENGLATPGEIAYITKKITAAKMSIAQARESAGLDPAEALDGLTKDGFVALKDALA